MRELAALGLSIFPCGVQFDPTTQTYRKWPKSPIRGESWKDTAARPYDDPQLDWSSGVIGVIIPEEIVLLDLDLYKGQTREGVERYLGCSLPWDQAFIQTTIAGGHHYAFRCSEPLRQIQSDPIAGMDTRVAGKGFICTGAGYTPAGSFGVAALAHPQTLPDLPAPAVAKLRKPTKPKTDAPTSLTTSESVIDALRYVDPECTRAEWVLVGMALKNFDPHSGQDLFDAWSRGDFKNPPTVPSNYVSDHIEGQWESFKPDGDTTVSTLFYKAIEGGWSPPSRIDVAHALGASADEFLDLLKSIRTNAHDVASASMIINEIKSSSCSSLQLSLLGAELKQEIKDKKVHKEIDNVLAAPNLPQVGYGKEDKTNALHFLSRFYPNDTLRMHRGIAYCYKGRAWEEIERAYVRKQLRLDTSMQDSKLSAAMRTLWDMVTCDEIPMNNMPPELISFNNGILNLNTGVLSSHSIEYFSTHVLPYDYNPQAACPQWLGFLQHTFAHDPICIDLLQEWMGYLMTRSNAHEKMMLMIGPPRAGKGTMSAIMKEVIGTNNIMGGSLEDLVGASSIIDLMSRRTAYFVDDAEKRIHPFLRQRLISRLQTITGSGDVSFHRLYHGAISSPLDTRITVMANSIPDLIEDSGALLSRFLVITLRVSHIGREDLTLKDRLKTETEGVAAWALQGLARLTANGRFSAPPSSQHELEHLDETFNPLNAFLSDCFIFAPNGFITSKEVFRRYNIWRLENDGASLSQRTVTSVVKDALRGAGVDYKLIRRGEAVERGFTGLEMKA